MARPSELAEFFAFLTTKPWWVSVAIGAAFFIVVRYEMPHLPVDFGLFENVVHTRSRIFSFGAFLFLIPACLAVARTFRDRDLFDVRNAMHRIRDMDWQTFEALIEACYRDQDFHVERQRQGDPTAA